MNDSRFIKRTEDGTEGIHPSKLTAEDFLEMGHEALGFRKAIKKNCMECAGGSYSEVVKCTCLICPLYPYRTGKNPFRPQREYSDEERAVIRDRFSSMRQRPEQVDEED